MERGVYFDGERVHVLPRPLLEEAARRPLTSALLVTHAGCFPRATGHEFRRPNGSDDTIILLCAAGSGWLELDGRRHHLRSGSIAVVPPGVAHAYGADDDTPWTIWWLHLRGSETSQVVEALSSEEAVVTLRQPQAALVQLDELLGQLERGLTPAHLAACTALTWSFLATAITDRMRPAAGTPLEKAMRLLDERLDDQLTVPMIAAFSGVSPSHLRALFRSATGSSPLAYLQARRMARARVLLDTTELPIATIAREVGVTDPLYFSRRFAHLHGLSPSAYRAQRKG